MPQYYEKRAFSLELSDEKDQEIRSGGGGAGMRERGITKHRDNPGLVRELKGYVRKELWV